VLGALTLICVVGGGIVLAVSAVTHLPGVLVVTGLVLWVVALFGAFALLFRASRREGTGIARSALRSIRGALRFAWDWMP
jgi:hypothetical protein